MPKKGAKPKTPKTDAPKKKGGGKGKPKADKATREATKRKRAPAFEAPFVAQLRDAIADEPVSTEVLVTKFWNAISDERAIACMESVDKARAKFTGKERKEEVSRETQIGRGKKFIVHHALLSLRRAKEVVRTFGSGELKKVMYWQLTKTGQKVREANTESAAA